MPDWRTLYRENDLALRERRPLIHHITNYVVMNVTANVTLAMGASPVMAHEIDEVEELAAIAGALVINIGTLSPRWVEAMMKAGARAKAAGVPVVLDPVGAGATALRTRVAREIVNEVRPDIIRGNLAEVAVVGGLSARIKGVDSLETGAAPGGWFGEIGRRTGSVVCVTGPTDWVTDGQRTLRIDNGHPMMANVTGTGCSATTAVAVFAAAGGPLVEAAALGLAVFGACGEVAAGQCGGPGSFQVALLDALYNAPRLDIGSRLRIGDAAPSAPV